MSRHFFQLVSASIVSALLSALLVAWVLDDERIPIRVDESLQGRYWLYSSAYVHSVNDWQDAVAAANARAKNSNSREDSPTACLDALLLLKDSNEIISALLEASKKAGLSASQAARFIDFQHEMLGELTDLPAHDPVFGMYESKIR